MEEYYTLGLMLCIGGLSLYLLKGNQKFTRSFQGIWGSSKLLSNPDSILKRESVQDRMKGYDNLYAANKVGDVSSNESISHRQSEYKTMVDSFYDLVTDFYEYGWGQSFHFANRFKGESFDASIARAEHFLAMKMKLKKDDFVLDMGCGVGGPMRAIARFSGAKVEGITINEYQVKVGNRHNEQLGFKDQCHIVQGDFMNMPWEDNTFDAIFAIESICHAPNKQKCYEEAMRVLKPNGIFVGYDWVMVRNYDSKNQTHVQWKEGIEVGNGLPTLALPSDVCNALQNAGLNVIEHFDMNQGFNTKVHIPWYATLQGSMTLSGFRMTKHGRTCTHLLVTLLETFKIAPKGSIRVSEMLNATADDLVSAGKDDIFTPSYFFMAQKP